MGKTKYKYNPKTLAYEEVQISFGQKLLKGLIIVAPSVIIGLGLAFVFETSVETPKEKELRAELEKMEYALSKLHANAKANARVLQDIEEKEKKLYRVALYAEEFPEDLRRMGIGGSNKYKEYENMSSAKLLIETAKTIDSVKSKLYAQSLSFKELLQLAKERENRLSSLPAIQPVSNDDLKRTASGFGWRIDPVYKTRKMHWGMDFTADIGAEVYSTGDGVVVEVVTNSWGYGKEIVIDHGFGYRTRYAHLSKFEVKRGDKVKRGDLIGLVGSTGKSTGPHLHYEVEKDGHKVNPVNFYHSDLTPEEYEKLIELSQNYYQSFD
ncbi:Peptidase family M23 [Lishizhenia tianjinensis]|uniref:Peptidase family M23 n=1 Tax=Lishizhenia tianjinensis TaxID=477690 RepID=A0A1I6ZU50_9FLAO|nr:M23 family metallopeptidase [Lishizhenia tianjinensis]SFT66210.1 Peptidase family M23 [Lishizhenia tianjinensis]